MRIAIVGFGKMGHVVLQTAQQAGHEVVAIIDPHSTAAQVTARECTPVTLQNAEVVIEFSVPEGIEERLAIYSEAQIPAVIATTGWYDRLKAITKEMSSRDCAIIWSGNFAIGVHLFFRIARTAARLMNQVEGYDPVVQEWFHAAKADSPSGTSSMLGEILLDELKNKKRVETGRLDRKRTADEIHLSSARGGSNPGTHTLIFDSPADSIEITHRARNREGYTAGALQAAAWITSGKNGFFTLDDMLVDVLDQN